jgi:hypothetical protein
LGHTWWHILHVENFPFRTTVPPFGQPASDLLQHIANDPCTSVLLSSFLWGTLSNALQSLDRTLSKASPLSTDTVAFSMNCDRLVAQDFNPDKAVLIWLDELVHRQMFSECIPHNEFHNFTTHDRKGDSRS